MLPSAFNVVEAEATGPAKARLAFLSRDRPPSSCESAVQWAGQHVGFIVNCADKSYSWHPFCVRFWLNPAYLTYLTYLTYLPTYLTYLTYFLNLLNLLT